MGLIARQAGAPIADGETSSGTEMEAEFDTIFGEINGSLTNVNIATGADIMGSKIADNTIAAAKVVADNVTGAKVADNTVTAEEMIVAAVTQGFINTSTGTEATTTSATFVDIPDITSWTVTPGNTSNFIRLEFICYCTSGASVTDYSFGFDLDGTPTADLGRFDLSTGTPQAWYVSHQVVTPSAGSIIVKPQYRRSTGTGTTAFATTHVAITKLFRAMIIPV